jgi:hypothetical protein
MRKKCVWVTILLAAITVFGGCNQGTSGGPGAADPPVTERMGQTDDTFSLTLPSLALNQGETKTIAVAIKRGDNFSEDVSLKLSGLPTGVTFTPSDPVISRDISDMELAFNATNDAALGDFTVQVTGHPTKGAEAVTEMKVNVAKMDTVDTANAAADAAKVKWNEYVTAMQAQMDQFSVKFTELQKSASEATGQAKMDADNMIAGAKIKLDAASAKMNELKAAGAGNWEKVKDGVTQAFEELKTTLG